MQDQSPAALRTAAWTAITNDRIGFLAVDLNDAQPMTAYTDADAHRLYFFTNRSTDLFRRLDDATEEQAVFLLGSKDRSTHVVVRGKLRVGDDPRIIDRLWNPLVAAWYRHGRSDPDIALLAFDCEAGDVWLNDGGPLKFVFELVKSNLTAATPDAGARKHVEM